MIYFPQFSDFSDISHLNFQFSHDSRPTHTTTEITTYRQTYRHTHAHTPTCIHPCIHTNTRFSICPPCCLLEGWWEGTHVCLRLVVFCQCCCLFFLFKHTNRGQSTITTTTSQKVTPNKKTAICCCLEDFGAHTDQWYSHRQVGRQTDRTDDGDDVAR